MLDINADRIGKVNHCKELTAVDLSPLRDQPNRCIQGPQIKEGAQLCLPCGTQVSEGAKERRYHSLLNI